MVYRYYLYLSKHFHIIELDTNKEYSWCRFDYFRNELSLSFEVRKWLYENTSDWDRYSYSSLTFKSKEDAMLFKLVWNE